MSEQPYPAPPLSTPAVLEESQHARSLWDTTLAEYPDDSPLRDPALRAALDDVVQFWASCIARWDETSPLWPISSKFSFLMWLVPEHAARHAVDLDSLFEVAVRYSFHCSWAGEIAAECTARSSA